MSDEKLTFKREALLIILGVFLGFIPAAITAFMQKEFQREQLFLERRIVALKDYSASFNKITQDVMPRARKLISLISEIKDMPETPIVNFSEKLKILRSEQELYDQQFDIWQADVNTQIAVVNAVFDVQLTMFEFQESQPEISSETTSTNTRASIIEIESSMINTNKNLIKILEAGQKNARLLTANLR
jgi:hypothetical protein